MNKRSGKAVKKKPAGGKAPQRKPVAAAKNVAAGKNKGKAASVKKSAQRKESKPTVKVKAARPAAGRKAAPARPSRAKTPAPSKKPVAVKPVAVKKAVPVKSVAAPKPRTAAATKAPAHSAPATVAAVKTEKPLAAVPIYKAPTEFDGFKVNDHVVYPTHGVGKIIAVEAQEIAGTRLELFVILFENEKMTLRVPLGKAKAVGMRILASRDTVRSALKTLRGRARIKRTMWSRRAQEYEAKINSGDILLIAEVVRDLHRAEGQPEQSYSERQIYESALERLAREVGAVEELNTSDAMERVGTALKKAA